MYYSIYDMKDFRRNICNGKWDSLIRSNYLFSDKEKNEKEVDMDF